MSFRKPSIFTGFPYAMIFFATLIMVGCGVKDAFVTEYPDVRAYYVERKDYLPPERLMVSIEGSATDMITLLTKLFQEKFDTTSSVVRMDNGRGISQNIKNSRLLFKVITPAVEPDGIDEFRKYFYIGEYILDRPGLEVVPEYFQYSVDALVKIDGPRLGVEFILNPYVDWNLFSLDLDGNRSQIPDRFETYYGVGSFKSQKTVIEVNKSGREVENTVWVEQKVDDAPRTKGVLENQLANRFLELAAVNNMNATIKTSYN